MYKAMYMSQTWRSYKPKKTLSLPTKRFISNFSYMFAHSFVLFASYKVWDVQMFGEVWFYAMQVATFYFVRLALGVFRVRVG